MSQSQELVSLTKRLFPTNNDGKYAALTSGLSVFLFILYIVGKFIQLPESISLTPKALIHLNMNRLSNYPLAHFSLLHLLVNSVSLYAPLAKFELIHGTVYTGIVLNILALATAIPFCLVGLILYPKIEVAGTSSWIFSLAAFFAKRESLVNPVYKINSNFAIPVLYTPVVLLLVVTILFPHSSFWGHTFGLAAGYLLAAGHLNRFIEPPTKKIVPFIESKLSFLISKIPSQFVYLQETAMVGARADYYARNGVLIPMTEGANKRHSVPPTPNPVAAAAAASFSGEGHTLN